MAETQSTSSISTISSVDAISDTFVETLEPNNSQNFVIVPTQNRTISFYGAENLWTQNFEKLFPSFDLKTLLQIVPHGARVLNYYAEHERLNEPLRNKLVDIIISHVYSYILKQ